MRFRDTVLKTLPQSGGLTYPELEKKLGRAKSQIGTALLELEEAGEAMRERIPKPRTHDKGRRDLSRGPRVVWRRVA